MPTDHLPLLTDAEIAELERLDREATPGPWSLRERAPSGHSVWIHDPNGRVSYTIVADEADAAFIAAARSGIPELLADRRADKSRILQLECDAQRADSVARSAVAEAQDARLSSFRAGVEAAAKCVEGDFPILASELRSLPVPNEKNSR